MTLHGSIGLGDRHAPHSFEYADAAARTGAVGLTAADVGKLAVQLDDRSTWQLTNHVGPVWLGTGATDHGALGGLADDDHPHYRLKAEPLIPVIATPYVPSPADRGGWIMWGGVGTLNVTLPTAAAMGAGQWYGVWNFGSVSPIVNLNRAGADRFVLGNSTTGTTLSSSVRGSICRVISNGVDGWLVVDGTGRWSDGTITRNFEANIALGSSGNAVAIGDYGDLVDSGAPALTEAAVNSLIEASAGGGGDDMSIYKNICGDFSVVQSGADTLAVFGLPFSIAAVQIKRIVRKPTGSDVSVIAARGATLECTWTPSGSIPLAGTILTASLGTLASTDEYIIEIEGPPKGYNPALDGTKTVAVGEPAFCNDGCIADLEYDSVTVWKSLLADGYNALAMTVVLGDVGDSVAVFGSNDPAGVADFHDITTLALGSPLVTTSGAYQTPDVIMFQFVKIVIVGTVSSARVYLTRFRK